MIKPKEYTNAGKAKQEEAVEEQDHCQVDEQPKKEEKQEDVGDILDEEENEEEEQNSDDENVQKENHAPNQSRGSVSVRKLSLALPPQSAL